MKNLFLGLLLTVGVSNMFYADTLDVTEYDLCIEGTCYSQTVTNFEDTCGNYMYSSVTPKLSHSCAAGQQPGSITTYYETRHVSGYAMKFIDQSTCP